MYDFTVQSERKIQAIDVTGQVAACLPADADGVAHVFTPHTTVALVIGEDEEKLLGDLERTAASLLAHCGPFQHAGRGNPNAPAHLFSSLAGVSLCVPVRAGQLRLGTFQRILLVELDGPKARQVWVSIVGAR
jgi:secondary thiamine-phosphate synthase enzyme